MVLRPGEASLLPLQIKLAKGMAGLSGESRTADCCLLNVGLALVIVPVAEPIHQAMELRLNLRNNLFGLRLYSLLNLEVAL